MTVKLNEIFFIMFSFREEGPTATQTASPQTKKSDWDWRGLIPVIKFKITSV